jgi:hypothetical protein
VGIREDTGAERMKGLMAGVLDALKTAVDNQTSAIQPVQVSSRDNGKVRCCGADDNSPYTQEPCAEKFARTVLKWGRGQ